MLRACVAWNLGVSMLVDKEVVLLVRLKVFWNLHEEKNSFTCVWGVYVSPKKQQRGVSPRGQLMAWPPDASTSQPSPPLA